MTYLLSCTLLISCSIFVECAPSKQGIVDEGDDQGYILPELLKKLKLSDTNNQEEERWATVQRMAKMEDAIDKLKVIDDMQSIHELLAVLEKIVWPQILKRSLEIYDRITDWSEKIVEEEYQQELIQSVERIRYKAGKRKCPNVDEAFYNALGACYKIGRQEPEVNPCPLAREHVLYESLDNTGVCDCVDDDRNLVFYPTDGQCYPLFQQGPCEKNEWLVFHSGLVSCRKIPLNCLADGKHAFGNPDDLLGVPVCVKLGGKWPCSEKQVVRVGEQGKLECSSASNTAVNDKNRAPLTRVPSCKAGSFRSLFNLCKRSV